MLSVCAGCVSGTTDYISFTLKNGVTYSAVCGELTGQHSEYILSRDGPDVWQFLCCPYPTGYKISSRDGKIASLIYGRITGIQPNIW